MNDHQTGEFSFKHIYHFKSFAILVVSLTFFLQPRAIEKAQSSIIPCSAPGSDSFLHLLDKIL